MRINKHDTNGVKPLLGKGELGYDDYTAGGDTGRVYVGKGDANVALAKKSEVDAHTSRVDNPHSVTKTQVGLGNVDNTSDVNKPVSTAQQIAINTKVDKVTSTDNAIVRFDGTTGNVQNSGVVIDDSGRVGIGTSNTNGFKLETYGKGVGGNSWGENLVQFADGTTNNTGLRVAVNGTTSGLTQLVAVTNNAASQFGFWTYNGTSWGERLRIDNSGNVLFTSGTGGLGYGTGAGGTVTQATSKSTNVTLNKPTGQIIMNNAALAAGASVSFILNNTLISATDMVYPTITTGIADARSYRIEAVNSAVGGSYIRLTNLSAASLSEAVVLQFAIIKGATA